jgi:hypothetical protein
VKAGSVQARIIALLAAVAPLGATAVPRPEDAKAIEADRAAIRSSSTKRGAEALRIRRAAYLDLGKLEAGRALSLATENDGPSACVRLTSDPPCRRPLFACGRIGANDGVDGRTDYTAARFALDREAARVVEDSELIPAFETWPNLGYEEAETHDRSDAVSYDVTLAFSSDVRKPMVGEAAMTVAEEYQQCVVVHVDACARRLGLYCEWDSWREGTTAPTRAKAVELTFARASACAAPTAPGAPSRSRAGS